MTQQQPTTNLTVRDGQLEHVKWIDLKMNGVLVECAILKTDANGNYYYVEIPTLDRVDKGRLARILHNQNASHFPLWELMHQITLNNGMNALQYFHQLVKVITPQGVVMNPAQGRIGTGYVPTQQPVAPNPADSNPGQV